MNKKALVLGILTVLASPLVADGIEVEPGQWEMKTTLKLPMMPQPQTHTVEQCIEDSEFDMQDMSTEDIDENCTFNVEQLDERTMKWSMDCPVEGGGTSHAEWQATSNGDSVEGSGKITVDMMGQQMEMTTTFSGQRMGECS